MPSSPRLPVAPSPRAHPRKALVLPSLCVSSYQTFKFKLLRRAPMQGLTLELSRWQLVALASQRCLLCPLVCLSKGAFTSSCSEYSACHFKFIFNNDNHIKFRNKMSCNMHILQVSKLWLNLNLQFILTSWPFSAKTSTFWAGQYLRSSTKYFLGWAISTKAH